MSLPAEHTQSVDRSVALFVMGVSRSGTSALTRVLSLCGGTLPAELEGANASNPRGHWEPSRAIDINDAILYRHRSSVNDPTMRLQEEGAFDTKQKGASIAEIGKFLARLPPARLMLIKEPRVTALPDVWFQAAHETGFKVVTVIAVRHPQEVVASLAARDGASPELGSALWLKYNLLAERHTRALPRVFVRYTNLLENWRREVTRMSTALAIDLSTQDEEKIDSFLQQDLHRQRRPGPVTDFFGADWMSSVYEAQCAAARDEPWETTTLDRIYEAYRANEHDFRTAFEDYRDHFDFKSEFQRSIFRPSITKKLRAVSLFATRLGMDPLRRRYNG
jgi:hypothetical protein